MDDFDFILSNDFFQWAKVALLPHLNGLLIMDEKQPCFVVGISKPLKGRRPCPPYSWRKGFGKVRTRVTTLIEIKQEKHVEVPDAVIPMLKRYECVMPPELPKKLPPRR